MRQVLQHARSGQVTVAEVPAPKVQAGHVLVRVAASLVSPGTERASLEFAGKNLLEKASARPDLVREVLRKVRRDGLVSAVQAVVSRLDQPIALGYSSAGVVVGVGEGISDLKVGDRVACAGAGSAVHAEFASVPRLLVARIPEGSGVSFDEAAFTTLGAVALHGLRTAEVKLGDVVAVIGLGLLGQLTVQLLKAAGCRVLGMDIVPERAELASRLGVDGASASASEFHDLCLQQSGGFGADAVLITAETPSNDPVNLAAEVARDRGIVVAIGTVGMQLERKRYYEKELDFRLSRSCGPGRYDAAYEQKGRDYPIGYVRWTETRNMEAFLQLVANGKVNVSNLITHRIPIARAHDAYAIISGKTNERSLGVLLSYGEDADSGQRLQLVTGQHSLVRPVAGDGRARVGLIGAGTFARSTLLPAIQRVPGVELIGLCSATGTTGRRAAEKFAFRYCTTDETDILGDPQVNTVVIATRHHLHARQVVAALQAGKHVFCEKPLCLTEEELAWIIRAYRDIEPALRPCLMVGFNRRFAPMAVRMKSFLDGVNAPLAMHYRVNAGFVPPDHWVHDPEQGGGRILGELCHFVDLMIFLTGSPVVEVQARALANPAHAGDDNVIAYLQFANGSHGTIGYLASGDNSYSKERLEVFGGGRAAVLEDFRCLDLVRDGYKQTFRSRFRQDKGHRDEWKSFVQGIATGCVAVPFDHIVGSTLTTLRIADSRRSEQPLGVDAGAFLAAFPALRQAD